MIKTRFLFFALFFALIQVAWSQSVSVSGTVTDGEGVTLPGVNVVEKGTSNGASTDFDGNYLINVAPGAVLVYSYVGFITQEIPIAGRTTIDITIQEDLQNLDEVVVIGYGTQLKEQITGSVSSIDSDELESIPQVSLDQLMQGRAAGVSVTLNSGQPGASVSVRIRGVNSIQGSSEPLYVIDGVPISGDSRNIGTSGRSIATSSDLGNDGAGSTGVSPLAALNPNDIESIDILKDASATAIYGSRGSNGVVIVTTKKGRNQKGKLTYSTYVGIQQPTNMLDVLELPGYARLQNEMGTIFGLNEDLNFLRPELLGKGTNWQQEIFSNAYMQNHQVSFSGGNEGTNYYLSAGFIDQEGTVIGSGFDRTSIRLNVNSRLTDNINVGANLTASRTNEDLILSGNSRGIVSLALRNNPATAVRNPDGSFAGPVTPDEIALQVPNPIAQVLSVDNSLRRDRLFGNIYAEFELFDGLKYRTEFGGDFGHNQNDRFQRTFSYGEITLGQNSLNKRRENNDFWVLKNMLTYDKLFGDKHSINFLVAHESQESRYNGIIASGVDLIDNTIPTLNLTRSDSDLTNEYKGSNALESYLSRLIYSYDERYTVTASIRADGSSKFAEGNRWGYFPSVSASWRLSNESFMENFDAVQNIKLYGGYGEVGNQGIPNFAYGSTLTARASDFGTGFEFANFANPDLQWEQSKQINLGLDFSLLDSRITATFEYYRKLSSKFLYQLALTQFVTGGGPGAITAPWVNLGEMKNEGVDIAINYQTINMENFSWNSNLTFSHNKNTVNELVDGLTINGQTNLDDSNQVLTRTEVGQPIGMFYGYKVKGIFRTLSDLENAPVQFGQEVGDNSVISRTWLGDIQFEDVDGDGDVDGDDRTIIGDPNPDFTFGWQNTFTYKNIDLGIFVQGSYGNDIFNAIGRSLTSTNLTYRNQLSSVSDYWSVTNPNGSAPRYTSNSTPNIFISDRYIEDGSYLRIQNVRLGYTFPPSILEKAGINRIKIYGSVQNLYTFTNYSGYDPEVGNLNQNALLPGIDNGRYPTPRTYTLGLDVEF